jgi:hypothetical protein
MFATKDETKDRRSFTEPARSASVWKNPPGSIRDPWPQAVRRSAWRMAHGAWCVRCMPDRPNSLGAVALKKRSADLAAFIPSVWLMIQDPVPLEA